MVKQRFTATFGGGCYIKAYGRKFYKKGVLLCNIEQNGNILCEKLSVQKGKAFDCLNELVDSGKVIAFDAVLNQDNTVSYISNVSVV
jgi:hypothetical protein